MHISEIEKHRQREQIIKTITHLHNARHHVDKTFNRLRVIYEVDDNCRNAKSNCEAIRAGIEETIKMLSQSASKIRSEFSTNEKPPPIRGGDLSTRLTPLQRELEKEGHLKPNTISTHTNPPRISRLSIRPFKERVRPKKPPRDPQNIPI